MKSFKQYLQEAVPGEDMERAIIAAGQGKPYKVTTKISPDAGKKIVKTLKAKNVSGMSMAKPTKEWVRLGGSSGAKHAKTDFIATINYGGVKGKRKISLKLGNSARLVSAGTGDALAYFKAATENIPLDKELRELKKYFNKMPKSSKFVSKKKGWSQDMSKGNTRDYYIKNKVYDEADAYVRDFKKRYVDAFKNNNELAYRMTYLAMTGRPVFGPRSPATADTFLSVNHSGTKVIIHTTKDKKFIQELANKTKPYVRLKDKNTKKIADKHLAGKDIPYLRMGVGLEVKKLLEMATDRLFEELDSVEILTLLERENLWNKFKNAISKMIDRAIQWIGDSWERFLHFLGLEPVVSWKLEW